MEKNTEKNKEKSTLKSYNPTTRDVLAELPIASTQELNSMVVKSHEAQKKWGQLPAKARIDLIQGGYDVLTKNKEQIIQLIHDEMGKTLDEAKKEVDNYCVAIPRLGEEMLKALEPIKNSDGNFETTTYFDPLGVCASITPWNYPLGMPHNLIIPSLMAGNTVIFKPSEEVPMVGCKYAEFLNEVLPKDVLQVAIGTGEQGAQLTKSDVQLITFTGSQATGKKILKTAADDIKRVILELGGKDPLIVVEDADLDKAAQFTAMNAFRNAGQVCVSTERIYVMESVADDFIEKLIAETKNITVGHMIHKKQKDHVIRQVKEAISGGAKVIYGTLNEDETNYFSPMILENVTHEMDIMKDETFGPVTCIYRVQSEEQAIELANLGDYALAGAVFSKDIKRAQHIARQLNPGMIGINRGPGGVKGSPWVGAKQSGYGFHGSVEGHRQFTQVRIVTAPLS